MAKSEANALLGGKDEDARSQIAERVGERLSSDVLTKSDRRAAEILARELVQDAIVRVRRALSVAVSHAKNLPRDIALALLSGGFTCLSKSVPTKWGNWTVTCCV